MDSIATACHAVAAGACVTTFMTIAVVGLGGLGMNGVTIAALQGATVYGVDIEALWGHGIGAYSNVKFDAIIDFTGVGSTTAEAIAAVRWIL
jgi:alcohol dehydrogenase, propanol-preferring